MPHLDIIVVIFALVGVIAWSLYTPERTMCEHCSHIIERSAIDEVRWFHIDTGTFLCDETDPHSTVASPLPYMEL